MTLDTGLIINNASQSLIHSFTVMKRLSENQLRFISLTDFDINNEVIEEQMFPKELDFARFKRIYQGKHKQKYGKELIVNQ